jgi:hypothetical protein
LNFRRIDDPHGDIGIAIWHAAGLTGGEFDHFLDVRLGR